MSLHPILQFNPTLTQASHHQSRKYYVIFIYYHWKYYKINQVYFQSQKRTIPFKHLIKSDQLKFLCQLHRISCKCETIKLFRSGCKNHPFFGRSAKSRPVMIFTDPPHESVNISGSGSGIPLSEEKTRSEPAPYRNLIK